MGILFKPFVLATLFAYSIPLARCQADPDNPLTDYKMPTEQPSAPEPKIHLGCYKETARGRALATYASKIDARMTVKMCETHCAQFDATMFGISRGTQCFCGDVFGTGTEGAPLSECNAACPGDTRDFCGATLRLNIYGAESLNTEPEVPSTIVYRGCFKEPQTGNALKDYPKLSNNKMTVQMCQDHCSAYQSVLFGVENGRDCFCGDSSSGATQVNNGICRTSCAGDKNAFCGANRHFNMYELDFSKFTSIGQWGQLVKFPVIPVAVALMPESGNLLAWSAGWPNRWTFAGNGKTYTAIYDSKTGQVSEAIVENTKHDMFCPGISLDANGKIVVNGGSTGAKTSIFNSQTNSWTGAADMAIPRAYQSSTLTSDGLIFAIGGSFRGTGPKNGEVFSSVNNTWTKLPDSPVAPMLMATGRGSFRADSHAWLFAWKQGYVFQAGPSRAMNWYGTRGKGGWKGVGNRGSDPDSMCGVFVMYDALAGKILTMGGSPTYDGSAATSNAHIITLGEPNAAVSVEKINNAEYARGYANGVVLPDGKVFIVGGQSYTQLFSDSNPQLFPEMFDPVTKKFSKVRAHIIPRNYHSTAILMPDATVFSGGGGLCNGCSANHFDGQFYSPPYLFDTDGKSALPRPEISSLSTTSGSNGSATKVVLGGAIAISMSSPDSYTFSLIRMSSVTHATNTDQRRIPLSSTGSGAEYTVTVPGDAGIALPGYWMLFALNSRGTPSVAKTVQVLL